MNTEDLKALRASILGLAEFYGEALTEMRLKLYSEVLSEFQLHEVKGAMREVIRDATVTRFPLPAVLASRIRPPDNALAAANEAASRIVGAIDRFGWNNPKDAKAYIGELGWAVVERQGSWTSLCENLQAGDVGTHRAQWRDLAKSIYERARSGRHDEPPAIPPPRNVASLIDRLAEKLSISPVTTEPRAEKAEERE